MLSAKLVVVGGDAKTKEVSLKLPATIGRGKEATLLVPHVLVSRKHCEIFERDGLLIVRDLDSLNGTFINNYRIKGEQALHSGELLTLGNITFRAMYSENGTMNSTVPAPVSQELNKPSELNKVDNNELLNKTFPAEALVTNRIPIEVVAASLASKGDEEARPTEPATPKNSEGGSSIDFEEFDFSSPQRSISIDALSNLPGEKVAQVSFIGQIGDEVETPVSGIDQVAIEVLGEKQKVRHEDVDPGAIESFIRKIR